MSMESTLVEHIPVTRIFSWNESTFITMKPQVRNTHTNKTVALFSLDNSDKWILSLVI